MGLHVPEFNPWNRDAMKVPSSTYVYVKRWYHFGRFDECIPKNVGLDWTTKRAALEASPFVVSLISYSGVKQLFMCSGTIVKSVYTDDGEYSSTILTSATLLKCPTRECEIADDIQIDVYLANGELYEGQIMGHDFHYNLAEVSIKPTNFLKPAIIGNINEQAVDPPLGGSRSFQLLPHRDARVELSPGMNLIALGQYHDYPYHIMAAPGALRLVDSGLDCEELLVADCEITKNGIGGPIISCSGSVIGMSFYKFPDTPFLPINIALKCLEHLQEHRKVPRPWLGVKLSDLHLASYGELEKLNQTFPNLLEGVVVSQMESESPASRAGLSTGDVIVQFDEMPVKRTAELRRLLLDKANKPVKLIVKRSGCIAPLTLKLRPKRSKKVNRWPILKEWSFQPNQGCA